MHNIQLTLENDFRSVKQIIMFSKKLGLSILAVALTLVSARAQQGVNDISFGKGLMNYVAADSSFSVKFAPRMQVRYYGNSGFDNGSLGKVDHDFLIRRSRFKFDRWAYHPSIKYKM